MLTARDIMTSQVVSVQPDSTVKDVADLLVAQGISAVPVLAGDRLVGIVSEGDLLHRAEIHTEPPPRSWWMRIFKGNAALATEYTKSHSTHVIDVMTADVATVLEDTPLSEIADLLERRHIKRVPVLRDRKVVGIVSRANLVRALATARHMELNPASRDDSGIRLDVLNALRRETWTSVGASDVSVTDGVVTFWGTVQSEAERKASHVLVENIDGVRGFDDHRILIDLTYGVV